ncbi:uncharacterized protein LOC116134691 [Pistacia vera]|uniref:uncharacterized protein LOC116134691 n=1 Tax=Pistacia vera TaxID=55513 RepID=UPI0012639E86|nr:uncharacterized protein LOC116134691 [Pistacia vera]
MEINQAASEIFVCQQRYATELLLRFGMENCKPVNTPLVPNLKLSKIDGAERVDEGKYRSLVGSLLYYTATRPDLMFTASYLSRFMSNPSELHFKAAKPVLSDARSTSGYVFYLNKGAISWLSRKQETVAQSTAEAKYVSAAVAVNQAVWLRKMLDDLHQVATISANGEHEIAELIARVIEKVGKEGVITVAELENPYILIHDKKISDMNSLVRILELALNKNRELLVVVEDVESDALAMLILNKHHTGVKVCAIKAHGFGENRRANLDNLAILTGGEVIFEDRGLTLDKVKIEMLGTAKKVTISVDDTIILHGGGDKKLIEERCEQACFGAVHCQLMDVVHPGMVPCTKSTLMPRTST